jgi:hypothetical protein
LQVQIAGVIAMARPEVTGCAPLGTAVADTPELHARGPPKKPRKQRFLGRSEGRPLIVGEPSKTITEFCRHEKISRSKYYGLRKAGKGPAELRVDGVVRITPEAHVAWRRENTVTA